MVRKAGYLYARTCSGVFDEIFSGNLEVGAISIKKFRF